MLFRSPMLISSSSSSILRPPLSLSNEDSTTCHGVLEPPHNTCDMVGAAIDHITVKNVSDIFNLNSYILKTIRDDLVQPLTHLFNRSLVLGLYPNCFKKAVIIPVFKTGNSCNPENYRPISLLTVLSKVFEFIIHKHLMQFLLDKNFLPHTYQFGFLPGKSTDLAIFAHMREIVSNLELGSKVAGVYLDIAKAFDTVNHAILINKLRGPGIGREVACLVCVLFVW